MIGLINIDMLMHEEVLYRELGKLIKICLSHRSSYIKIHRLAEDRYSTKQNIKKLKELL